VSHASLWALHQCYAGSVARARTSSAAHPPAGRRAYQFPHEMDTSATGYERATTCGGVAALAHVLDLTVHVVSRERTPVQAWKFSGAPTVGSTLIHVVPG
jgi:hypothetical protein